MDNIKTYITRAPEDPRSSRLDQNERTSEKMLTDSLPKPEKLKKYLFLMKDMKTFINRAPEHLRSSRLDQNDHTSVEMLTDNLPSPERLKN